LIKNSSLTPSSSSSNNNIIFECSDLKNDIGLMVTTTTTENNNNKDFQLHLYDGYNDIALVMNIAIKDFANMFDALGPYFQEADIEF
jgi:hypothetical protein